MSQQVTPEPARRSSSLKSPGTYNNVIPLHRPYIAPQDMMTATRDTEAGWSPIIDEDQAFADEACDLVGEWIFIATGALAALIVVAFFLIGRGVL